MKKTYINPEMEVIRMKSHYQLLAGSEIPGGGSTDQNLSRGWFDDYEE